MATPFYSLSQSYGAPDDRTMYHTPFVRDWLSPQVPRGEFERWLGTQDIGGPAAGGSQVRGFDRRSQFNRSLYGQSQSGYQAAVLNNPGLTYRDYVTKYFADTGDKLWSSLTPQQRGENPGMFSPRLRVVARA